MADRLDDPAQGQVVAGHARLGRERARTGAGRVVFAQAHDDESRQCPVFSNSRNSANEGVGVVGVADRGAPGPLAMP